LIDACQAKKPVLIFPGKKRHLPPVLDVSIIGVLVGVVFSHLPGASAAHVYSQLMADRSPDMTCAEAA